MINTSSTSGCWPSSIILRTRREVSIKFCAFIGFSPITTTAFYSLDGGLALCLPLVPDSEFPNQPRSCVEIRPVPGQQTDDLGVLLRHRPHQGRLVACPLPGVYVCSF